MRTLLPSIMRIATLPQVSPTPEEMRRFVESEISRWGKIIERAGLAGSE
jgi:tripartite-type tricarboxylate transporter receptor subunit TctC